MKSRTMTKRNSSNKSNRKSVFGEDPERTDKATGKIWGESSRGFYRAPLGDLIRVNRVEISIKC